MNNAIARGISLGILTTLLNFVAGYKPAFADIAGSHPHYLHARSDLRKVEKLLDVSYEHNVNQKLREARRQANDAIYDIDRASILDGKDLNDHPAIDVSLKDAGRLHEVLRLLYAAHRDLAYNESNASDFGWRDRAFKHIDHSINDVKEALRLKHWDEQ